MTESEIIRVSGLDIDQDKEFYGPVPAEFHILFGVPQEVCDVAAELNGQRTSVHKAVNKISAVTDLVVFIDSHNSLIGLRLAHANSFNAKNYKGKNDIDIIYFR